MSYELGSYDPREELGGFSLKSISKAVKKVASPVQKVLKKAAPVVSFLPIPGAGIAAKVVNSGIGKKVTAVSKTVTAVKKATAPPKPPPKVIPIPTSLNRAGSRQGSGASLFADVRGGSSTTAVSSKNKAKFLPAKPAPKPVPKPIAKKPVKVAPKKVAALPKQAEAAGIRFKKRAKKGGGTEVVAVNTDGAVVSSPIPPSVLKQTNATVEAGPPIPIDTPVAPAPPIPSAASVAAQYTESSGGGGGGGGGGMPYAPSPDVAASVAAPSGSLFDNPLLIVGGGAIALLALMRR